MNRRSYLIESAGVVALCGCLGATDGNVRPDEEPTNVSNGLVCENNDFNRHGKPYDAKSLKWGDTDEESLRVNRLSFEYGETAEIQLNAGFRGTSDEFNFEMYTANGWQDIRGTTDGSSIAYTDEGVSGDHTWEIDLTEDGITDASVDSTTLQVCPDLVSGRYRFVFWGLTGDTSVAVGFDINV